MRNQLASQLQEIPQVSDLCQIFKSLCPFSETVSTSTPLQYLTCLSFKFRLEKRFLCVCVRVSLSYISVRDQDPVECLNGRQAYQVEKYDIRLGLLTILILSSVTNTQTHTELYMSFSLPPAVFLVLFWSARAFSNLFS